MILRAYWPTGVRFVMPTFCLPMIHFLGSLPWPATSADGV